MAQLIDGIILGILIGLLLAIYSRGRLFSLWISPLFPVYLVQSAGHHTPQISEWWWGGYYTRISLPFVADFNLAYPSIVQWIIYGIYYGFFHTIFGQTPGKMMKGLVVLTPEKRPLSFPKSLLRWGSYLISLLPAGLGFWLISSNDKRQAWHDLIVGTQVWSFVHTGNDSGAIDD